ncbi:MAG: tRNA pseudouridine(55) synthase TruB [Cyanothece sp. SIO2G6]|nr:tRNA pseudouridine(55) synthase TruB [Cyanothece sp. SIO2G6]
MEGFINLNKPAGWTSHDCVAKVRRLLRLKRVGHGGTLDPAATGVLPIALGRATRLLPYLPDGKAYHATIRFGVRTTTDDLEGDVLAAAGCPDLSLESLTALLPQFHGKIQQIPPKYSAIQVGGKRLYELARAGVEVDVPVRTVEIDEISVLDWRSGDFPELDVAIACGSGTYIRAIARDLGDKAGVGATLAHLVRTNSSGFFLDTSITLEDLTTRLSQASWQPISPQQGLSHLPLMTLSPEQEEAWLKGQAIPKIATSFGTRDYPVSPVALSSVPEELEFVRVCNRTNQFLGVGYWVYPANAPGKSDAAIAVPVLQPKVVFN